MMMVVVEEETLLEKWSRDLLILWKTETQMTVLLIRLDVCFVSVKLLISQSVVCFH